MNRLLCIFTILLIILPSESYAQQQQADCCDFHMAVSTNMLYDALAIPNIGVEFALCHGWSARAHVDYGWWSRRPSNFFWRMYGADLGTRWYLNHSNPDKALSGHHFGAYLQATVFDFELGGRGWMGGEPGKSIFEKALLGGGFEYGYSLPVAKRLNIDFTVGIGYLGGKIYEYTPECGQYVRRKTRSLRYIGPTKAEISLVWIIGCR